MYDGYLAVNGTEILNVARVSAYIKALAPALTVSCPSAGLAGALGHSAYTTPSGDNAPWFRGNRLSAGMFLGLFPGSVEQAEDSTRQVPTAELAGDGAVHTKPRYGSREIRFTMTALATSEEGMSEGLAWLRDVLAADPCGDDAGYGCTGREVRMFSARPADPVEAYSFARTFHECEVIEGPLVTERQKSAAGTLLWELEFTISAGVPFSFTSLAEVGVLDMNTALNHLDPVGQNCSTSSRAYEDFIADPYFTAIAKPPRPPVILPPNLLAITSWRRRVITIPIVTTERWGRVVPVVSIVTGNSSAQQIRLRFYRGGADSASCEFDGEFLVSYLPANSVLTLDGIRRRASVRLPDGRSVPAGHLLFGSAGAPFQWPLLGCQNTYSMTADLMPGQSDVAVLLSTAVRE